ncbi:Alpha-soluble NSF attachment protein 2 [Diplonema papillatum]|nr:Alpha-soluble NSF attachment protein 2 [Diplonema papillatum]
MSSKGQELFDQAEKKLKKWFSFSNKYEEAGELFSKAAHAFKVAKEWKSAGTAFMRCSDCHHHNGDSYDCTEALVEAAKCFKKVRAEDTELCYKTAIDMQCDEGRFSQAAKLQKELAEYYKEGEDYDKAVEAYKKAVDYFAGEEQTTSANTALLEVAKIYAEVLSMPEEAIRAYETVAKAYLQHGSMKYQVKGIIMQCMMARFSMVKSHNAEEMGSLLRDALGRYSEMDIQFAGTRECELLEMIVQAVCDEDPATVSKAAAAYEDFKKLDDYQVGTLLYLKKTLEEYDDC